VVSIISFDEVLEYLQESGYSPQVDAMLKYREDFGA
jgi:hypothetical protein